MKDLRRLVGILVSIMVLWIVGIIPFSKASEGMAGDKLKPEEIIAKNLESIGTPEARAAIQSRIIMGAAVATVRVGGSGTSQGSAVLASTGEKSLVGIIFGGSQEYSNEKMAYNGKNLTHGESRPGIRTNLGGFILNHDVLFKEGLIGGVLSAAWPLYNLQERGPKLSSGGTKKIDGKEVYLVKYEPRKGSNLTIKLYFDAESFHHLRSEYEQMFPPPPVTRAEDAARQKETRLRLTEDFSDFKPENGLTLPHTYKMQLNFETTNQPLVQDWVVELSKFYFNQKIKDEQFDVTASISAR